MQKIVLKLFFVVFIALKKRLEVLYSFVWFKTIRLNTKHAYEYKKNMSKYNDLKFLF